MKQNAGRHLHVFDGIPDLWSCSRVSFFLYLRPLFFRSLLLFIIFSSSFVQSFGVQAAPLKSFRAPAVPVVVVLTVAVSLKVVVLLKTGGACI